MNVLVLGGGDSPEREVSLRSAKFVADAVREAGHKVIEKDPRDGLDILDNLPTDTIVFPILHGVGGEDGTIQKELEKRNLLFLGSDSETSAKCWDKWQTLQELKESDLPVPEGTLISKESFNSHSLSRKPYVLKVVHGGSSIGVLISRDPSKTPQKDINEVFSMESPAILEELVVGTEITVSILGNEALPVVEIRPPQGLEFDFENKYNGKTEELCPPETISVFLQKQAQQIAIKAHQVLGCQHFSRSDLIVTKGGEIKIFDINTIPGMTDQSLYPKSALAAGLSMPELVEKFIEVIKRDYKLK